MISHQQIRLGIDKQARCSGIRLKLRLSWKYRITVVPDLIWYHRVILVQFLCRFRILITKLLLTTLLLKPTSFKLNVKVVIYKQVKKNLTKTIWN